MAPRGDNGGEGSRGERPDYKVYRSRRGFRLPSLPGRGQKEPSVGPPRLRPRQRPRLRLPGGALRNRPWLRWLVYAALVWAGLSIALFSISTLIQQTKFDDSAEDVLDGGANLVTDSKVILVIGADRREEGEAEPGADPDGPARADTLLLIRAGGGAWERLSIPRDTLAEIPGRGAQKINGAYAFGGARLQIETVERFLGIDIDHAVEVDFAGFKDFIDALGGIKIKTGCVVSRINGGFRNGGFTLRLRAGEHTLDGEEALALARTRKNECNRSEDDRTRARRQQKILAAIKDRVVSPTRWPHNFIRGPWIGWTAPKAIVTNMGPVTMSELFVASVIGPDDPPRVLKPSGFGPGGALVVSEAQRQAAVQDFLRD